MNSTTALSGKQPDRRPPLSVLLPGQLHSA